MSKHISPESIRLLEQIDSLLLFLHEHQNTRWDQEFERPINELRVWRNYSAAVSLLKNIPLGGMGGLLDRDYGKDQCHMNQLCETFTDALNALEQKTK